MLLDNGNIRYESDYESKTRGQMYELNETDMTARLVLNANLGSYSFALGSAQQLPNGNFYFGSGFKEDGTAESVEVDPSGRIVTKVESATPVYRALRMSSLYTDAID